MKRIIISMLAIVAIVTCACGRDKYVRDVKALPVAAQSTLKKAFKADVSLIKVDKELFKTEYEVILTDGSEVKFDSDGNWKDVEVRAGSNVPDAFVPAPIRQWVKKNHSNTKIVSIERDGSGYDVELSNGIDVKFTGDGSFKRYDD